MKPEELTESKKRRPLKFTHNKIVPKTLREIEKGLNDVIRAKEESSGTTGVKRNVFYRPKWAWSRRSKGL